MMNLRQAASTDAKVIQDLLGQLGYPDLSMEVVTKKIADHGEQGYHLMVAEENGEVVAFIALHWFEVMHGQAKMGRITAFCVDERYRSKGYGEQIIEMAEMKLFDLGCESIEVTSNVRRTRAHEFYLREGYEEDSRRFVKRKR